MILHRDDIQALTLDPLHRTVAGIKLGDLQPCPLQGGGNYSEVMVLRGDVDDPLPQVFDRLIASMMAELELEGLRSQGQGYDLMAQAYAKYGHLSSEMAHGLDGLLRSLRVPRAIGQKQGIRSSRFYILNRAMCREHHQIKIPI